MAFDKKTVRDIDVAGKVALMRADYNVPLDENGKITDDLRIRASLPTLQYLLDKGARKVVVMAHLGRPDGQPVLNLSLKPVSERLGELLGHDVVFLSTLPVNAATADTVRSEIDKVADGSVILLENLRFTPMEEENSAEFANLLKEATGADLFVQDGFGVVHRAHTSTEAITHVVPSVAGLLLEKEVSDILAAIENPKRPLVTIFGGAKVSDKIETVNNLVKNANTVLIGGAMANSFLRYLGKNVGASKVENDIEDVIKQVLDSGKVKLPVDGVVATDINGTGTVKMVDGVVDNEMILDIGPKTVAEFAEVIKTAGTVIWNGTMGMTEKPAFAHGSEAVAEAIANSGAFSVIGGGDTTGFILEWQKSHPEAKFDLISTGGGASLELMAGDKLPGVESLN